MITFQTEYPQNRSLQNWIKIWIDESVPDFGIIGTWKECFNYGNYAVAENGQTGLLDLNNGSFMDLGPFPLTDVFIMANNPSIDPKSSFTYYPDNQFFTIENNVLKIIKSPDYEIKSSYSIAVSNHPWSHKRLDIVINKPDVDSQYYNGKFLDYEIHNRNGTFELYRWDRSEKSAVDISKNAENDLKGRILSKVNIINYDSQLIFDDISLDVEADIKGVFDQITGLMDPSAEMYRLYNSAFGRFPDTNGLKYWIRNYVNGINDKETIAKSFINSDEFITLYGENNSNEEFTENLYTNILGRTYDKEGFEYWVGNLNNGIEERYQVLLGFSESEENLGIFSDQTGIIA
jgi:hypothetical protein